MQNFNNCLHREWYQPIHTLSGTVDWRLKNTSLGLFIFDKIILSYNQISVRYNLRAQFCVCVVIQIFNFNEFSGTVAKKYLSNTIHLI